MPLSKLIDNLSEGVHNNKCADCKSCLDYMRSTRNEKLILNPFSPEKMGKSIFEIQLILQTLNIKQSLSTWTSLESSWNTLLKMFS